MKKVQEGQFEQIAAPYTLEKLITNLDSLPDSPFKLFLKTNLQALRNLKPDDRMLQHQLKLMRSKLMTPAILAGISWKDVVKRFAWTKPYYQWIKCLAAGKNSQDCLLPAHFQI